MHKSIVNFQIFIEIYKNYHILKIILNENVLNYFLKVAELLLLFVYMCS